MNLDRRDFLNRFGIGIGAATGFAADGHASHPVNLPENTSVWMNMLDQGAVADGTVKNTELIRETIERLAVSGGGTLYFPPGRYLTGPIHFKSNIHLHLEAGAVIVFSDDFDDYYPAVQTRWQGLPVKNFSPLVFARDCDNISITGQGTLDGSGKTWWDWLVPRRQSFRDSGKDFTSSWQERFKINNPGTALESSRGFLRPPLFQAYHCTNIRLQGIFIRNSPHWTTHFLECDKVLVDGVDIYNPHSPNTDGINPESSRNVRISNCHIHVDDDCITIKSGKGDYGRKEASPCENIVITNCIMTAGAAGVGIGSEMSAGVRNVVVTNCVFDGTARGVHIKTNRERGGLVENVQVSNLVMRNMHRGPAVHINMKYWIKSSPQPVSEKTPRLRKIQISNISGIELTEGVILTGLEEMPIQEVALDQLKLSAKTGLICSNVDGLVLSDVWMTDTQDAPFVLRECNKLILNRLQSDYSDGAPIVLENVEQVVVDTCEPFIDGQRIIVKGARSRGIQLPSGEANKVGFSSGANRKSIQGTPE